MILWLVVIALALASVNANCTDPCNCNGLSWEGKFTYPLNFSGIDGEMTYDYLFSPCGAPMDCGNTTKPVVICQIDSAMSAYVVIGASSSVAWKFNNEADTHHLTVMYGDGDMTLGSDPIPRKAVVSVTVVAGDPSFVFIGENPTETELVYIFEAKIPPAGGVAPGYIGIVFISLALGAVILYLIISAIMFRVKGARGIEVVPNNYCNTFWDLPCLVKDGFMFTIQPCLGGCSKKNTYSSLSEV